MAQAWRAKQNRRSSRSSTVPSTPWCFDCLHHRFALLTSSPMEPDPNPAQRLPTIAASPTSSPAPRAPTRLVGTGQTLLPTSLGVRCETQFGVGSGEHSSLMALLSPHSSFLQEATRTELVRDLHFPSVSRLRSHYQAKLLHLVCLNS